MVWYQKRQNKYGISPKIDREYDGVTYHSKKEASYAAELDLLKKGKQIDDWTRQVKISLDVGDYHIANYYIDFVVTHNGKIHPKGTKEYIEVKGFETEVWRLKWKLFEALYGDIPDIILTVVK
jgi:hypothetical protein